MIINALSAGSAAPTTARRRLFRGMNLDFLTLNTHLRNFCSDFHVFKLLRPSLRGEDEPARSPRRLIAGQRMWLDVLMKFPYLQWKGGGSRTLRRVSQRGASAAPTAAVHHGIRIQWAPACRIKALPASAMINGLYP